MDRIRCIPYREIRDKMIATTGNSSITRQLISEKLRRSEDWVKRHSNKTTEEYYTQFGRVRPPILSQESKNIITSASGIRRSGSRKVAREILEKIGQRVSHLTVHNERH